MVVEVNEHKKAIELEQVANALKEINEHLEQNELISKEVFDSFSHELRTPMAIIKAYTDLLLDEKYGELTSEQKAKITLIKKNNELLIDVVFKMLDKIGQRK